MLQRTLAGYRKMFRLNNPSVFDTLDALGSLYYAQHKSSEAERMYQLAIAGYTRLLGFNHDETLRAINNLATL